MLILQVLNDVLSMKRLLSTCCVKTCLYLANFCRQNIRKANFDKKKQNSIMKLNSITAILSAIFATFALLSTKIFIFCALLDQNFHHFSTLLVEYRTEAFYIYHIPWVLNQGKNGYKKENFLMLSQKSVTLLLSQHPFPWILFTGQNWQK